MCIRDSMKQGIRLHAKASKAVAKYEGAIVLVTHDEGAVQALNPERVLLMPDGDEDLWNDSYLDLVAEE